MQIVPVLIKIQSVSRVDGSIGDTVSMTTGGVMTISDDTIILGYEENLDEEGEKQIVTLTLKNGDLFMEREGAYSTQMFFSRGQRYEGRYSTPFGEMEIAIHCNRLYYKLDADGGDIDLSYQLDLNGQNYSIQKMKFTILPQNV